jgi:hypothetical protein
LHHDEDQQAPHNGGDATHADDAAARDVAEGLSGAAINDQSREV